LATLSQELKFFATLFLKKNSLGIYGAKFWEKRDVNITTINPGGVHKLANLFF